MFVHLSLWSREPCGLVCSHRSKIRAGGCRITRSSPALSRMSLVCRFENSVPSSRLLQWGFTNHLRRSTAGFYVKERIYSFCTLTEFTWWENTNKFPVQFHQLTAIQVRTKTNLFLLPLTHSSLECVWPLLPFISDLLWSCYILRDDEVSDLVLALHPSLLLVLCCDQSALLPFVPPSHFRHASCCLNMCHDLWGRRECLAALGFPRATLVPLQQNSSCDSPVGAEGREGQSPWALAGKGMGIKKWTKHCREQNIRVAPYIAGLHGCMFDFTTFCLIFAGSRLIPVMGTCLPLNIGSKKV